MRPCGPNKIVSFSPFVVCGGISPYGPTKPDVLIIYLWHQSHVSQISDILGPSILTNAAYRTKRHNNSSTNELSGLRYFPSMKRKLSYLFIIL
jgi:hypothetical protein